MRIQTKGCLIVAGLVAFNLTDHSGQDARFYSRQADFLAGAGNIAKAMGLYLEASGIAAAASQRELQHNLLNNIGACQLALYRFQDAAQTLLRARSLAQTTHNQVLLGSADGNLAAVYFQSGDLAAAESYAREAVRTYPSGDPLEPRALMTLADILGRKELTPEAEAFYRSAIHAPAAGCSGQFTGWLHYGQVLFENHRLDEADFAFSQASSLLHRCEHLNSREDVLLWNLSRSSLQHHQLRQALSEIDAAIRMARRGEGHFPPWRLYQISAQVKLAMGRSGAALEDARAALQWARTLRAGILPDNDDRVGMEGVLDEVYSVLIEAGNRVYLEAHDPALLRETFEAAEENRAQSLEALLPAASNWRARLNTPEYRYKLAQLLAEQRSALRTNAPASHERVTRLETELSQLEAQAGAQMGFQPGTVLDRVRASLPRGSALLSFRLGDRASWLWTMQPGDDGRTGLHLYRLPPKAVLRNEIRVFQAAIQANDTRRIALLGHHLYLDLLGRPDQPFERSAQWFISLDEPLYTLPIPALVVETGARGPVFLTQRKTVQVLPGAQLFAAQDRTRLANHRFLLAGDGIYNRADPRYGKDKPVSVRPASWGMARLPGSGAEVRFAANIWPNAELLTGARMTKDLLLKAIDRDPDVIHIASHVVEDNDRWHTGILALGVDPSGEPDLLTPQEIQLHPIHSRLVVMTGCSSGTGDVLPASGLMGLTRAWLAAGAGVVLATRWPTMDESGDGLVGNFYLHLLQSRDGNIPRALQQARRDMIARGGWRGEPRYWSSFFLIGVR